MRRCKLVNMACTPSCPDYARNLASCGRPLNHSDAPPRARTRPPSEAVRPEAVATTVGEVLGPALDRVLDRLRLWVSLNW